jgi:hypothetical protein
VLRTGWLAGMVVTVLTLGVVHAEAQTQWDVAGTAGLVLAHADGDPDTGYAEDWSNAAQGGIVLGRYLSRHLKVELEASATTRGLQYASRQISVEGSPYPYWLLTEVRTSVHSLGGVMAWQFRDNEWVHPFVLAGVSADWDDSIVHVPQQFYYGNPRGPSVPIIDDHTEQRTDFHLRAVFGGGAKLYFTERTFMRADGRYTWNGDRQHLALRAGLGIDF